MIEINWGQPLHLVVAETGDVQKFSTIEQVQYWLRRKWPVNDGSRANAISAVQNAMDCIGSVTAARLAFIDAAKTAGFEQERSAA